MINHGYISRNSNQCCNSGTIVGQGRDLDRAQCLYIIVYVCVCLYEECLHLDFMWRLA